MRALLNQLLTVQAPQNGTDPVQPGQASADINYNSAGMFPRAAEVRRCAGRCPNIGDINSSGAGSGVGGSLLGQLQAAQVPPVSVAAGRDSAGWNAVVPSSPFCPLAAGRQAGEIVRMP